REALSQLGELVRKGGLGDVEMGGRARQSLLAHDRPHELEMADLDAHAVTLGGQVMRISHESHDNNHCDSSKRVAYIPGMAAASGADVTEGSLPLEQARRRHLVLRFEGFALDTARVELRREGASVPLAPQPFDLLWLLASRPGALVERDVIRQALWGGGALGEVHRLG